ncbi:hypothetical protein BJX61DRAFT_546637 [Aspergillus egyptiacus]|nr:hypothetical protein BJX61DRAFT_546637 [Aspergillus egyptiacus]
MPTPIILGIVSILNQLVAIIVHLYRFSFIAACIWTFEALLSTVVTIIYHEASLWRLSYHCTLAVFYITLVFFTSPRDDGRELRRLDKILTNCGFHFLARVNREVDFWFTPVAERNMMLDIIFVWQTVASVAEGANALTEYATGHRHVDTDVLGHLLNMDMYRQYNQELRPNIERLLGKVERVRNRMAMKNIWNRAWVRHELRDIKLGGRRISVDACREF